MRTRIWLYSACASCAFFLMPAQAATIYVDANAQGANNGRTWRNAHTSLIAAIGQAMAGDRILVAAGRYEPIELKQGVKIFGGFAPGVPITTSGRPEIHRTYIDGREEQRAVRSVDNDSSTILRGFHIVNGRAPELVGAGGGLYLSNSSALFVQCVFADNAADFAGGAVANYENGAPTFVNCIFKDNGQGGDRPTPSGGGAFFNHQSAGAPTFVNCLFVGNKAGEGGAVISLAKPLSLINCTFTGNEATIGNGGAFLDNRGAAVVRNCIFWDNVARRTGTAEIYSNESIGRTLVAHSNVRGGWPGSGNVDVDPLFVNAALNDYRIQATSPSRDAGRSEALPDDIGDVDGDGNPTGQVPLDLAGRVRIYGASVDMGAFEWAP